MGGIRTLEELEERVKDFEPARLALVCAQDEHSMEAVFKAQSRGLIQATLIGERSPIEGILRSLKAPLGDFTILEVSSEEEAAILGVSLIRQGKANTLMKGKIQTKDFLKAVVDSQGGIKSPGALLSHLAMLELPGYHKILGLSDGGMVIRPGLEEKKKIIENAVFAFQSLGYVKPRVAVLAAVEKVNPKMEETVHGKALKDMDWPHCIVEGPLSYDLTFSKESARIKGFESPITGEADFLLFPDIASCNILSKGLIFSGNAKMAGIILGAQAPIVLTSRGASGEEKYYSILLASLCGSKKAPH